MNIIRKLLTKHRKRGRPIVLALLTCIIVVGLVTGIVWFNDYLGVKANTKDGFDVLEAYSYGNLDEFVKDMEKHFSEGGDKGKYGLDLDADGGGFKCDGYSCSHCHDIRELDGQEITDEMLQERCDTDDPKSPYRYWFWVKVRNMAGGNAANEWETGDRAGNQVAEVQLISKVANTLTALSSFSSGNWRNGLSLLSSSLEAPRVQAGSWERWHTEYYYTSTNKLDHKVNAKSGKNCTKVPMGNVGEGGIVADQGNATSGNKQLQIYVTDIKPFHDMMTKDLEHWYDYADYVYLHTVAGVSNASHTNHRSAIYKESEWEKCSAGLPSMQWELKQSYNQYLHFEHEPVTVQVYAVKSEGDEVTDEEMKFRGEHQLGGVLELDEIPTSTGVDFSSIKKFTDSDGKTYKLKGIRVQDKKKKQTWKQAETRQAFMANDSKIFGSKKKTNKYSKKSDGGDHKDTLTGQKCVVTTYNELKIKLDGDKFKKTDLTKPKGMPKPENLVQSALIETPSGKISEKELQEILTSATYKVGTHDTRICLIYQAAEEADVTLQTDVYDWDGEKEKYLPAVKRESNIDLEENPDSAVLLGKLAESGESGPFDLISSKIKPKTGSVKNALELIEEVGVESVKGMKDVYSMSHGCGGEKPNHYLGKISIEYTDSNGEEHKITYEDEESSNSEDYEEAKVEELDYADPFLGEPVWNGTEAERDKIQKAIDSLYKEAETIPKKRNSLFYFQFKNDRKFLLLKTSILKTSCFLPHFVL